MYNDNWDYEKDLKDLSPSEFYDLCMEAISSLTQFLNENYDDSEDLYTYESAGYSEMNKFPVFILLTKGSTALSKIIQGFTGDSFTHSSISFKPSLDPMYSFGTSKKVDINSYNSDDEYDAGLGFVKTYPSDPLWVHYGEVKTPYSLYVTFVDKISIDKMQKRLEFFLTRANELKYSFTQLIRVFFHIKSKSQAKWFCSRFVAEIISAGKSLSKDPSLYRPQTLLEIPDVEFLLSGDDILSYNERSTIRALSNLKRK